MTKVMVEVQGHGIRRLAHAADAIVSLRTTLRAAAVALFLALVILAPRLASGGIGREAMVMLVALRLVEALLVALAVLAPTHA